MYTRGNMNQNGVFDVLVIGGGPAGMMAAAKAGERGRRVLLLEKNPHVGKKLLITGGGRCNVTNNKPVPRDMLSMYKGGGKFLFSTFTQHGVSESITWFKERGVLLKEENEGRLFPITDSAKTICDVLAGELKAHGVTVKTKAVVKTIVHNKKDGGFTITLESGEIFNCQSCVIATGGTSRPETGSTGDAYAWLKKLGHTIVPNNFALVPLTLKNTWTKKLSGLTLPAIKLTLFADGKKLSVHNGKLLFTHVGITGPTVLNLSKMIGELLAHSSVTLMLDLFPNKDAGELKVFLRTLFTEHSNKKVKNVLTEIVPAGLVTELLSELSIDGSTVCHSLSTQARTSLAVLLKAVPLHVRGLLGADKAVVSSGGVALSEINFKTMESKIVPHIYVVGDMLNIDRPSGGYSLQLCWSTGYVAGSAV
jgi:predicted Rossmann fold flavoprotein